MARHIPRMGFHMLPDDIEIWARFIDLFEDQFEEYEYDRNLGPRVDLGQVELPEELRALAERLLTIRADVIAKRGQEHWIIEVKPNAGLSAFGQILAYDFYYRQVAEPNVVIYRLVVTDYLRHYMGPLFAHYGIWCLVLPAERDRPIQLVPPGIIGAGSVPVKLPQEVKW